MSILILNMEMPKNCGDCPFFVETNKNSSAAKYYCQQLKDRLPIKGGIPKDCPLIELPPHGRLIDADEFYKDINESILLTDGFKDAFNLWFDEQPTIIEADDSVKQVEWETHNDGIMYWWECSRCHHEAWYDKDDLPNYCPYCGAKMKDIEAEVEND